MRKLLFLFAMLVAMTTTATAQIETGKYYRLKSTANGGKYLHIGEGSAAAYGTHGNVDAIEGDENDQDQWFQFIEDTDSKGNSGYKLKSYNGDYITCAEWNVNSTKNESEASVLLFDGSEGNYTIKWFNTHKNGIRYFKVEYVGSSGKYHPFGDVEAGNNNIASWEITEIAEQVQFYTVTYNYQYNGVIIATETHSVREGEAFPTAYKAPYVCTTPDDTVTEDAVITIECNLPFEYAETQDGISQWYFIKLHSNKFGLINANADNISWEENNSNIILGKEDMQTWAFVGNKSNGFKLINKGTGKVLGNDNGLKLVGIDSEKAVNWVVSTSTAKSDIGYFCLRIGENGNYLNAYPDGGYIWNEPDAGSTIILTKRETSYATGYYRISYNFGDAGIKHIQGVASNVSGKANAMVMTGDEGAASLFYYNGYNMLSYTAGQFVNETGTTRGLQSTAGVTTFIATDNGKTKITTSSYMHANISGNTYFIDHCDADNGHAQHNFIVNLAETLPVTISAAKYASFYAPVAVTIPEGVTAYYLTEEGISENSVDMTPIEAGETIPANTGVILYGEAGTYNFRIGGEATADVRGNLFAGTVAKTNVPGDAYILGVNNGTVGLYKVEGGDTNGFTNGSHKAYLPVAAVGSAALSAGFTFEFEGTTAIEEVVTENSDNVYYDLSGRRVENPTQGIYIVNGKKVLVK